MTSERVRMDLRKRIVRMAEGEGVTHFGVGDLSEAYGFIVAQGGAMVAEYPISISIGITLPKAIVDQLPRRMERAIALTCRHHGYEVINQRLDLIASLISGFVQGAGYRALPIAASGRVDNERLSGIFSHKLAAHLAGLGWIGKSCLVITPKDGPRVRWATILTDAPLNTSGKAIREQCGDCEMCVNICPVKAFTGRAFQEGEPREARYDAKKCDEYFKAMEKSGQIRLCGMCIYACPYGK